MLKSVESRLRQVPFLVHAWRSLYYATARARQRIFRVHPKRLYDIDLRKGKYRPLGSRALLSYIVHPFSIARDDPRFLRHINIWRAQEIVRILHEMGYTLDVIDYRDTTFIPRRMYDLFIGHGGINFENIAARLADSTIKIYFSTGCYWHFHNEQELARLTALYNRRGIKLPPDRFINDSEEAALLAADGIIGVGSDFTRQTYADFSPVIMINSTAFSDNRYELVQKDFEEGRKHFLYYAGGGNVHKGLDLLLEVFLQLEDYHLWICTRLERQFKEVYSEALFNRPNIHAVGWVQPRSSQYYEVMNRCNWAILPSCSEGGAQSAIECMNQGLIPVVTRACGLDIGDYGVLIEPCTIDEIARVVLMLSTYSTTQCREMSSRARHVAVTDFSEATFRRSMTDAVQSILRLKTKGNTKCSQVHT